MNSIDRFLDHLSGERGFSPNTLKAYRRDLEEFVHFVEGGDVSKTRREEITGFLAASSKRGLSWATVGRRLAALKSFYAFLVREGDCASSPAADVPMPRNGSRLPKTLKRSEVDELLSKGSKGPFALRDRAILETFYATGLRVSELAGLKVTDMNLEFGFVRAMGKGGKERVVPLGKKAIVSVKDYLASLREARGGRLDGAGPLFLSRKGGALGREAIYRIVRRAAGRAGLQRKVGPHTMRHSFASHLVTGGADLRAVQEMLGHASVATTEVYTHVENRWLKEVHKKFHPRS
ncbi:MAG: site-specific tyrosine recombinase/integron integrase [Planctomycetota bacterium]|jgi:integrase/recombinase XerD